VPSQGPLDLAQHLAGATTVSVTAMFSQAACNAAQCFFASDADFKEAIKAEQTDAKLVEKVDSTYMDPTDFSPMK